jgi:hypothetical protein
VGENRRGELKAILEVLPAELLGETVVAPRKS